MMKMESEYPQRSLTHAFFIFILFLAVYAASAMPSLGWRDGPEFVVTSCTLGIPHPAGFPTYSLLTRLISFLPAGGIPLRIALCSALFSALSMAVLYLLTVRVITLIKNATTGASPEVAALIAVMFCGASQAFWSSSSEPEVYTLHVLLMGLSALCVINWMDRRDDRWLYAGGLIYGLASGVHAAAAFYAPAYVFLFFCFSKERTLSRFAFLTFFFFVGFSVYLYLPIRASSDVAFKFGAPYNLERFISHVTDAKDVGGRIPFFAGNFSFIDKFVNFSVNTTPMYFWTACFPFIAAGAGVLLRKKVLIATPFAFIVIANILLFISWKKSAAFLPAVYFSSLFAAVGLSWILENAVRFAGDKIRLSKKPAFYSLLAVACFILLFLASVRDRSDFYLGTESFRSDFEEMAPGSVVLSGLFWFHQRAYQDVYRMRDDVSVLFYSDITSPQWFNPVTESRYPAVEIPPPQIREKSGGSGWTAALIDSNLKNGRTMYLEPDAMGFMDIPPALTSSLTYFTEIGKGDTENPDGKSGREWFERLNRKISREILDDLFLREDDLHAYYINFLIPYASYFSSHGSEDVALDVYLLLERLFGPGGTDTMDRQDRSRVKVNVGALKLTAGQNEQAMQVTEDALRLNPDDPVGWGNLGQAFMNLEKPGRAVKAFQQALALQPDNKNYAYNLAKSYLMISDVKNAVKYFRLAGELATSHEEKEHVRELLKQIQGKNEDRIPGDGGGRPDEN